MNLKQIFINFFQKQKDFDGEIFPGVRLNLTYASIVKPDLSSYETWYRAIIKSKGMGEKTVMCWDGMGVVYNPETNITVECETWHVPKHEIIRLLYKFNSKANNPMIKSYLRHLKKEEE